MFQFAYYRSDNVNSIQLNKLLDKMQLNLNSLNKFGNVIVKYIQLNKLLDKTQLSFNNLYKFANVIES